MEASMSNPGIHQAYLGIGVAAFLCLAGGNAGAQAIGGPGETIVFLRHGEKPQGGLGQLDCQGLNRALALPAVIARQFGRPDAIFAPDPADAKIDSGKSYDYVRPLATIEPTAIALGMPVDTSIGVADWQALGRVLQTAPYRHALVLVAWEHKDIVMLARALLTQHGGRASDVPDWDYRDYDSIYVIRIAPDGGIAFERRHQGLNGQPVSCPVAPSK
jgi:hypothetical protein